ncbi:hypothetical protein [Salipiger thiooxidans]|uniref:hypothetical protein n=1 Tax=Salipiger thiooxidans TaxID=282683 RepID=UPI001CD43515|nr:hypothetical protein [Salipiger thiooxidans]MCA0846115.1 hypothetical protein [Salipiger thiooxidans]
MKLKYEGPLDEVTVRHVTFEKGKTVELSDDDPRDAALVEKLASWPEFSEVKRGRKPKTDDEIDA